MIKDAWIKLNNEKETHECVTPKPNVYLWNKMPKYNKKGCKIKWQT